MGTPTALLLSGFVQPGGEEAVLTRVVMTLIGTTIALAGSYLLWPASAAASGNARIRALTQSLHAYREAVLAGHHERSMQLSRDVDRHLRAVNAPVERAGSGRRADRAWAVRAERVRCRAAALRRALAAVDALARAPRPLEDLASAPDLPELDRSGTRFQESLSELKSRT